METEREFGEPLLRAENISADIGQFHILDNLTFSVPEGAVTVILGRNGAGKTTTMRTLMGFIHPSSGRIRFGGQSIDKLAAWQVRQLGIGYVPEDSNIFANLSVEENLKMGVLTKGYDVLAAMESMMELFPDLRAARSRLGGQLSGGQRQMLAVASVLMEPPRLLLIDEPSKGLSPLFVHRLAEALLEIRRKSTILLVEQNFYLAAMVGDYYVLLEDGRVVRHGPMQELVDSPELQGRYLGLRVSGKEA
jgi:branched-chain amino acid transport system ATP-binding protein